MRALLLVFLAGCGGSSTVDGPLGAFSMRYEEVGDASPDMRLSFGDDAVWVVVNDELTAYDMEWTQTMRIGAVQAVGAVLDVGVWLSNGLVLRSEAGAGGLPLTLPTELGTPIDLRRGDGGELWILGEASNGGALASSIDAGVTWTMRADSLLAGSAVPETLELRSTLGGVVVVLATDTDSGSSTTWKVTGSGAEEWEEGSFLTYPAAALPDGWATTLEDDRQQFDAVPAGWTESWTPTESDGWTWTHAANIDLSPERVPLEVVGADGGGVLYVHDETTLYRSIAPFGPEQDQASDLEGDLGCDRRYNIDWSVALSNSAKETRVRNGLGEDLLFHELFADGITPLSDGPIAPDSGDEVTVRLESWFYVTDVDGRCRALVQGSDLKAGEHWLE
ncbi:MAG: hypothetical protein KC912_03445 [Proteobacteria bacterium]|nr:hypothetical protein [Pseudomonadota bacterium]